MMPGHPDAPPARAKKGVRDPQGEAEAAQYRLPDGRAGMPATAFKAAIAGAARAFDDKRVSMTRLRVDVFVHGEGPEQLVPIEGAASLREDTPRNANGGADLRYRLSYWPWSAILHVTFPEDSYTEATVVALVDAAGDGGVGDWRPSAPKSLTGTFGCWQVATDAGAEATA